MFLPMSFLLSHRLPFCRINSDTSYRNPKVFVAFEVILSPTPPGAPTASAVADKVSRYILAYTLQAAVAATDYLGALVGMSATFSPSARGFSIQLNGFTEVMPRYAKSVAQALKDLFDPTLVSSSDSFFATGKSNALQQQYLDEASMPYLQLFPTLNDLSGSTDLVFREDMISTMKDAAATSPAAVRANIKASIAKGLFVESYVHGSAGAADSLHYTDILLDALNSIPATPEGGGGGGSASLQCSTFPQPKRLEFPLGKSAGLVQLPTSNVEDENSAIVLSYQLGRVPFGASTTLANDVKHQTISDLFTLLVKEECFDVLRTKEQLGYVVACLGAQKAGINTFNVIIQGSGKDHSPAYYHERIENFLEMFKNGTLKNLNEDTLKVLKATLKMTKTKRQLTLTETAQTELRQVAEHTYLWVQRLREAETIDALTPADLQRFFQEKLAYVPDETQPVTESSRRKLALEIWGRKRAPALAASGPASDVGPHLNITAPYITRANAKEWVDTKMQYWTPTVEWISGYQCAT